MKVLKCSDVSGGVCAFEAHGESEKEVLDKMNAHAMEAHKDMMENASEEDKMKMMESMKANIKEEHDHHDHDHDHDHDH